MVAELAARLSTELTGRLPAVDLGSAPPPGPLWTGPELVLVIDDYDLVAGPASSPLAGLADLLAQGHDLGFHVVVARRVAGLTRSSYEPFLQRLRELTPPTLLMSGTPEEGAVIGRVAATPLPPGRARLFHGHRTGMVQLLHQPPVPAPATPLNPAAPSSHDLTRHHPAADPEHAA
jgi:S-DNA-T family DNA segregation ATPase FtsK/SpoIIIE